MRSSINLELRAVRLQALNMKTHLIVGLTLENPLFFLFRSVSVFSFVFFFLVFLVLKLVVIDPVI